MQENVSVNFSVWKIVLTIYLVLLVVWVSLTSLHLNRMREQMSANGQKRATVGIGLYNDVLEERKLLLLAQARLIAANPAVLTALQNENRQALLELTAPDFSRLEQEFSVTHLYFINAQRRVILRAHRPGQYSDLVNRGTLTRAELDSKEFAGTEIGRFGQFTLRAVHPVKVDGTTLGFVEVGEEVSVILEALAKTIDADIDLLLEKRHFSEKSKLQMSDDPNDVRWHSLPREFIAFSSDLETAAKELPVLDLPSSLMTMVFYGQSPQGVAVPVTNYANLQVGRLVFSERSELSVQRFRSYFFEQVLFGITTLAVLAIFGLRISRSDRILRAQDLVLREKNTELISTLGQVEAAKNQAEKVSQDYQVIMENLPDVFFHTEMNGRITMITPACYEAVGYHPEELLGTKMSQLYVSQDDHDQVMRSVRASEGQKFHVEVQLTHKSGEVVWISSNVIVRIDESGSPIGIEGIARNITDNKEFQAQLQQAKQKAETANTAKSTFLTMMSHELRTPMNGVLGMAQLLKKTPLDVEQEEYCQVILESGNKMVSLLSNILDISKIESGKQELLYEPLCIQDLVRGVVGLFSGSVAVKGLELKLFLDPKISGMLIGDEEKLNRCLVNLVGNAIKFTEQGEIKVSLSLDTDEVSQQSITFEVSDTGIGIEEDKQEQIFEPFRQADERTTRSFGGTGLGLAIVKQLVELQGGTIQLSSEEGQGSSFTFTLDFQVLTEAIPRAPVVQMISDVSESSCLLVEDDELNQHLTLRLLNRLKVEAVVAHNGVEAVEWVKKKQFDLILLDLMLPKLDGYDVARILREDPESLNQSAGVVVITAANQGGEEKKCRALGVNGFCTKPLDFDSFEAKILPILAKAKGASC